MDNEENKIDDIVAQDVVEPKNDGVESSTLPQLKKPRSKFDEFKSKMSASISKTKKQIDAGLQDTKKKLDEGVASTKKKFNEGVASTKKKFDETVDGAKQAINDTKKKINDTKQKFLEKRAEANSNLTAIKKNVDARVNRDNTTKGKIMARIHKIQSISLVVSVLLTLIMAVYSVSNMAISWNDSVARAFTITMLVAYVVAFIVLMILFKVNKKSLNKNMKNYKFAIKLMKKVVNLINLGLSIAVMFNALSQNSGPKKIFAFVVALLGIIFAIIKAFLFLFKFIRKKKKERAKARKRAETAAKQDKIRAYIEICKNNAMATTIEEEIPLENTMDNSEIKQIIDALDDEQVLEIKALLDDVANTKAQRELTADAIA